MQRKDFIRICAFAGVAGVSGVAKSEVVSGDLHAALREIGVSRWTVVRDGAALHLRCQVKDFDALARKAGTLGDGKVRVAGNTLSFGRQGRQIALELIA